MYAIHRESGEKLPNPSLNSVRSHGTGWRSPLAASGYGSNNISTLVFGSLESNARKWPSRDQLSGRANVASNLRSDTASPPLSEDFWNNSNFWSRLELKAMCIPSGDQTGYLL